MSRVAFIVVAVAIACLTSASARAACKDPGAAPSTPDGAKVSREEMIAAQKAFTAYDAAVREYTTCLETSGGSAVLQNAAVHRVEVAAEKFNAEYRKFKKRNTG
jgi:hypothetical protein